MGGSSDASRDELEEWFRLLLAEERNASPLEGTRKFLRNYVDDAESLDEVGDAAARTATSNPRPIRLALQAIEALIAGSTP